MYLIAGLDETVYYSRTETGQPTVSSVTATLDGVAVTLSESPAWDEENGRYTLVVLGSEKASAGELVFTWNGTDADGGEFSDAQSVWVLASDAAFEGPLLRSRQFLRLEESDPVVLPLVLSALESLKIAGVSQPDATDESGVSAYEVAVATVVSMMYSGGESKLGPAIQSAIWQLRYR
jgi:hypothetical protein